MEKEYIENPNTKNDASKKQVHVPSISRRSKSIKYLQENDDDDDDDGDEFL
jgi:hypothetical protein